MAQFKKAQVKARYNDSIHVADGYEFEHEGMRFTVFKEQDKPICWSITDPCTGMCIIRDGSRKKALALFEEKYFERFMAITATDLYHKRVDEFIELCREQLGAHEDVPAEEVAEEAVEEVTEEAPADEAPAEPQPAKVTEHNIWFAEKVDGASEYKGKRKRHQGMWWLPNTPANRERFGIEAA